MAQYQAGTEWSIVLLGKTGVGKSTTGNTLLDNKTAFDTKISFKSSTSKSTKQTAMIEGVNVNVVDTPGFCDTDRPAEEVHKAIARCLFEVRDGIHVFAYTIKPGRFTEEDGLVANLALDLFGRDMLNHTVIVITRKDELDGQTVNDIFESSNVPARLKRLYEDCNKRVVLLENKCPDLDGERRRFYKAIQGWGMGKSTYKEDPRGFMKDINEYVNKTNESEPHFDEPFWKSLTQSLGKLFKIVLENTVKVVSAVATVAANIVSDRAVQHVAGEMTNAKCSLM